MWVDDITALPDRIPEKLKHWLLKPQNLGASVRKVCREMTLKVIEQKFAYPFADELEILGLNLTEGQGALLREIFLEGDGVPFTFGRVVVPEPVYLKHKTKFDQLGSNLIGETILYNNPDTVRGSFQFAELDQGHPLYVSVVNALPTASVNTASFWARRSVFRIGAGESILISEVILEAIPEFVDFKSCFLV